MEPSDHEGSLRLGLRRHVRDHFVGEFFGDVFEARLDEHVALGPFMARFPDGRAGCGVDQPEAQAHTFHVIAFLTHGCYKRGGSLYLKQIAPSTGFELLAFSNLGLQDLILIACHATSSPSM